mgnify:CR=1 FL=1
MMSQFSRLCSILEVCKIAQDDIIKSDLSQDEFKDIYLDNIVNGLFDLKLLGSSFDGANTLIYLINGSVKAIDGYIKRLIDEIRATLKKNDLKASRTKIEVSKTFQEKIDMRNMVIPGARIVKMVVMKFTPVRIVPSPPTASPTIQRSAPIPGEYCEFDRGA